MEAHEKDSKETMEMENEEEKGWFERWADHLRKTGSWDESANECLVFPYACF